MWRQNQRKNFCDCHDISYIYRTMQYNTSQKRMALPEYGRSVQNMVDHALTIDDRDERQLCANTIIEIMGNMFPHLRDVPDFKHKLWDHLAMMSDFKLDIDYPYEIVKKELLYEKPKPVAYQQSFIRYRHYGKTVERLIDEAIKYPEGDEKNNLVALILNHMRQTFSTWNNNSVEDDKIANDLYELSEGQLQETDDIRKIMEERMNRYGRRGRNNPRRGSRR